MMDFKKEFERMMAVQTEIALATSVDNKPNVRIVNFYYDTKAKVIFFASFMDNQKILEFEKNKYVAFTTISKNGEEHVRVTDGTVCKSKISVFDIKDKFLEKIPQYIMCIPEVLEQLNLFEIHFDKADVVIDFENVKNIII